MMLRSSRLLIGTKPASRARMFSSETIMSFKNVCFEYAPLKPILNDATFNIKEGSKVTIMGQNGAGKSTILKLMNNTYKANSGSINIKPGFAISAALQAIPIQDREKTVYEFFLSHLHGAQGGIEGRIAAVLQQVEMQGIKYDRLIKSFSGGQQARLLLASALIVDPDILLLDEPTNNLDVRGIDMLRDVILSTPKTCVVISHDEDFLNSFTDSVLYLDNHFKKVEYYDGNYHVVKREIANRIQRENTENARLMREAQQKKAQAGTFANKGGGMRKVAKKMREEAADLEESKVSVRKEDKSLKNFSFPLQTKTEEADSLPIRLLTINSLQLPHGRVVDFSQQPILVERGLKIRIKGPNGIGKTTCLENLVKGGEGVHFAKGVKIGYYRQDFHNLDFNSTVIDTLIQASDGKHDQQGVRFVASSFLLTGDIVRQKIFTLSEGQKGLLLLACLVLQEPAVLVMDEPTNHINFRHLPAIAKALNSFPGSLLIVSHDEDFMSNIKIDRVVDLKTEVEELDN